MGALATTKRLLSDASMALSRLNSFFSFPSKNLHNSRFAHPHELENLHDSDLSIPRTRLLLGVNHFDQPLCVRPTVARRELGNLLIVAPTRGGKGILAVSQLLTWKSSAIVNDIKGDLFLQTSGYRSELGEVYVIEPSGFGHAFDPLYGKKTEDELFSLATHILHTPNEGEGAIFTQRTITMLTQMLLAARIEEQPPL